MPGVGTSRFRFSVTNRYSLPHSVRMEWLVYIIQCDDGSLYTGVTTDLERRLAEHRGNSRGGNSRGAKYFNGRTPRRVVYTETGHNRSSACQREAAIKQLSRRQKLELLRKN